MMILCGLYIATSGYFLGKFNRAMHAWTGFSTIYLDVVMHAQQKL